MQEVAHDVVGRYSKPLRQRKGAIGAEPLHLEVGRKEIDGYCSSPSSTLLLNILPVMIWYRQHLLPLYQNLAAPTHHL